MKISVNKVTTKDGGKVQLTLTEYTYITILQIK